MKVSVSTSVNLLLCCLIFTSVSADNKILYEEVKSASLRDPATRDVYRVVSLNVAPMTTTGTHRSVIKVFRSRANEILGSLSKEPENIQTIKFHPTLVDFDLDCSSSHCYMVTVTSRTKQNLKLFSWQRTQFDLLAERDTFARPQAVELFKINLGFYIVVAQDQLHLAQHDLSSEHDETTRFFGCAIFKFFRGSEQDLRYLQFVRLPYNPRSVSHFIAPAAHHNHLLQDGLSSNKHDQHYLVFSIDKLWKESSSGHYSAFRWSPLDDNFWPFRLTRNVIIETKPGYAIFRFPEISQINFTQLPLINQAESVESCFNQLERLLIDRDMSAHRLIDSSKTLWRSQHNQQRDNKLSNDFTEIKSQVIVHGNVIVKGSLLGIPRLSVLGIPRAANQIFNIVDSYSPVSLDYKLKQAIYKLNHIRGKLSRAVYSHITNENEAIFNSQINFLGHIKANNVIFGSGISNSNVKINRVPFKQLEHELVALRGAQNIPEKVSFTGTVLADLLEIHGLINQEYFLKDAVDITSKQIQVIDSLGPATTPNMALYFDSVTAPEVIISHNATFNGIHLSDFITRDNRVQYVSGKKTFAALFMKQLKLGNPNILLNGFNITKVATEAVRLRDPNGKNVQVLSGSIQSFKANIKTKRLLINGLINQQINVSSIIHDSVKTFDASGIQMIQAHKNFRKGLAIAHLTTEGMLNGVQVNQIFNLNSIHSAGFGNPLNVTQAPIYGSIIFRGPVVIKGNLNVGLVNGVDLSRRAIKRYPFGAVYSNTTGPQLVSGLKKFTKPLHITNQLTMLNENQLKYLSLDRPIYLPLVNDINMKSLSDRLAHQIQDPPAVQIDNLIIEGNLNLDTTVDSYGYSPTTLGNYANCPLDLIHKRLVLNEGDQNIDTPVRIDSLRSRHVTLDPGALNGFSFPQDFVLKSPGSPSTGIAGYEPIFGEKSFDFLSFGLEMPLFNSFMNYPYQSRRKMLENLVGGQQIHFGEQSTINNISYGEMQTFVHHEKHKNLTGETVYQTLNVHGNIVAKRINGYRWPDDILLKYTNQGQVYSTAAYKRIYSPLVFMDSSSLSVANQLVLRGPIQLDGFMNGVNLTEFARNSATYGDKDLLSMGRPMRNKIFLGGLIIMNEIRSQGLVNGINITDMARRVVTLGPSSKTIRIFGQKVFMSDVTFLGPLNVIYLNNVPLTHYLKKIQLTDNNRVLIYGKKTVTGNLKLNQDLIVQGLINKIDFADLKARSISLNSKSNEIQFNKTLIVEGDVYMDNLFIDERDGVIDGVKLTNLIPLDKAHKTELVINDPKIINFNNEHSRNLSITGTLNDCQITCNLEQVQANHPLQDYKVLQPLPAIPALSTRPSTQLPPQYPYRQIQYDGRNYSLLHSTPPYATDYTPTPTRPVRLAKRDTIEVEDQKMAIQNLALRPPTAIIYERQTPIEQQIYIGQENPIVESQLNSLRNQMTIFNLLQRASHYDLVVGFIESDSNDISQLFLPEQADHHSGHFTSPPSFLLLDQIDYPFKATTFHMSVGVSTNQQGNNITSVFSTLGGSELRQLSVLPIDSPNNAMFLKITSEQTLFLLISQDNTITKQHNERLQCPRFITIQPEHRVHLPNQCQSSDDFDYTTASIHVYLFHALQNSSYLHSAYFDLYQTIDLPPVDSFDHFQYKGSTYAVAVSRYTEQIYLLLLRGYSGFQVVSNVHAPAIERIKLLHTREERPILIIYQSNGLHRLMESVII